MYRLSFYTISGAGTIIHHAGGFIPKLEYIEGKIYEQRNENGRFCF